MMPLMPFAIDLLILQNVLSMRVGLRLDINELKARQGEPLAQAKCKRGRKKRASIDKGMILATFTARINP